MKFSDYISVRMFRHTLLIGLLGLLGAVLSIKLKHHENDNGLCCGAKGGKLCSDNQCCAECNANGCSGDVFFYDLDDCGQSNPSVPGSIRSLLSPTSLTKFANEIAEIEANKSTSSNPIPRSQGSTTVPLKPDVSTTSTSSSTSSYPEFSGLPPSFVMPLPHTQNDTNSPVLPTPTKQLPSPTASLTPQGQACLEKCRQIGGISCKKWEGTAITCCKFTGCQWPFYCRSDSLVQVEGCDNRP